MAVFHQSRIETSILQSFHVNKIPLFQTIHGIRQQSNEVQINISMSTPGEIERGLLDGRLHVGAIALIAALSGLDYLPLYEEQSLLYCSRAHPLFAHAASVDVKQLIDTPAVVPSYRLSAEAIGLHQGLDCAARATDREAIAFLILTGKYVGFLPDHYARAWVKKGQLAAIAPGHMKFRVTIAVATRGGRRQNLIVDRFLEELQDSSQK